MHEEKKVVDTFNFHIFFRKKGYAVQAGLPQNFDSSPKEQKKIVSVYFTIETHVLVLYLCCNISFHSWGGEGLCGAIICTSLVFGWDFEKADIPSKFLQMLQIYKFMTALFRKPSCHWTVGWHIAQDPSKK